jgi:hypothetical protein
MKNMKHKMTVAALIAIFFVAVAVLQINAFRVKAAPNITVSLNGRYEDMIIMKGYQIMGELENVGDTPATNITVTINCYDASNTFINSTKMMLLADGPWSSGDFSAYIVFVLLPGAKISFTTWIGNSMGGNLVDHCTATVSFIDGANLPAGLQITVTNAEISTSGYNSLIISGTIKNAGTSRADQVYIYGTCYDSNGAVIASGVTGVDEVEMLEPDEVADFEFSITDGMESLAGRVASYVITAQSFTGDAYSGVPQYTETSVITAEIPEFPSIICIPLLLIAMAAVVIFRKKRKS